MKALSFRQPWAHAVVNLGKSIENRREESPVSRILRTYREPFLIHASAGIGTVAEFTAECNHLRDILLEFDEKLWESFRYEYLELVCRRGKAEFWPLKSLARGGIIGEARVVASVHPTGMPATYHDVDIVQVQGRAADVKRWHFRGQWGFVLADVQPLPFLPWKGALGLWECDGVGP